MKSIEAHFKAKHSHQIASKSQTLELLNLVQLK